MNSSLTHEKVSLRVACNNLIQNLSVLRLSDTHQYTLIINIILSCSSTHMYMQPITRIPQCFVAHKSQGNLCPADSIMRGEPIFFVFMGVCLDFLPIFISYPWAKEIIRVLSTWRSLATLLSNCWNCWFDMFVRNHNGYFVINVSAIKHNALSL